MNLNFEFPKKINNFFKKYLSVKDIFSLYGGRGSGKSHSIARLLIGLSFKCPGERCLCCREIQNSIEDSVYSLLIDIIEEHKLDKYFNWSVKSGIQHINGFKFIFKGLKKETVNSLKSVEGAKYCWVEEAHTISQRSLDILIPTIVRNNGYKIFFSLNPEQPTDPVYMEYIDRMPDNACKLKVNYPDNRFCSDGLKKTAEAMRATDYEKYKHIYLGEFLEYSDALVFKDKFIVKDFDSPDTIFYYGADFGFHPDPLTGVRCFIKDKYLFVDYELYGEKIEIDDMEEFYSRMPGLKMSIVIADCARPDLISHMQRRKFKFIKGEGGKDPIFTGISFLRSFKKIIIHPRCKYTIQEFSKYSFVIDKLTGKPVPGKIEDKDNHIIDALRYSLHHVIKKTIDKNLMIDDILYT